MRYVIYRGRRQQILDFKGAVLHIESGEIVEVAHAFGGWFNIHKLKDMERIGAWEPVSGESIKELSTLELLALQADDSSVLQNAGSDG